MLEVPRSRYWRIWLLDRLARWVITAGGLLVIGVVIGMLVVLVSVVVPLFGPAKAQLRAVCPIPIAPPGTVAESSAFGPGSGESRPGNSKATLGQGTAWDRQDSWSADSLPLTPSPDGQRAALDFCFRSHEIQQDSPIRIATQTALPPSGARKLPATDSPDEQGQFGAEASADRQLPVAVGVELVEIGRTGQEDLLSGYVLFRSGWLVGFELVEPPGPDRPRPEAVRAKVIFQKRLQPEETEHSGTSSGCSSGDSDSGKQGLWIAAAKRMRADQWTLLWSDGSLWLVQIEPEVRFEPLGGRRLEFRYKQLACLPPVPASSRPVQALMQAEENGDCLAVVLLADNRIFLRRQKVETDLFGESGEKKIADFWMDRELPGQATAMALSERADRLYVGTHNGYIVRFAIDPLGQAKRLDAVWVPERPPITALSLLLGDTSLVVGTAYGSLSLWFPVRKQGPIAEGEWPDRLTPIRFFRRQEGEVRQIISSQRNKAFLSLGGKGVVDLDYGTTGRHLLRLGGPTAIHQVAYSSRANAVLGLGEDGRMYVWQMIAPHADVSWQALVGRLWYEGHEGPKFLWQSSGTDEPKMSLIPLVFGTLKASFYAMLFALPLGLGSAMYVSHFTKPAIRRAIKPAVEIMAAIPTVVVGFLILLWAAPLVSRWLVAVLFSLLALPVTFVLWMLVWQLVRRWRFLRWIEDGYEFLAVIPPLVLGILLVGCLSGPMEESFFGGNFRQWLYEQTQLHYDQLNALVVALGLGFAIIPIIFSISEDALSSVPHSLTAASLALGASRWQTLWRVVLPSASPGIFAAVMIGLGRAVGETMIVFMAAGNTPILDPSPFNGFRTLSANIAVEISEHPQGGTLYRVLFLCAVVLFLMTFVLNTAAELVRGRLGKRYGQY